MILLRGGLWGAMFAAVAAVVAGLVWGSRGAFAAATFGLVATAVQLGAIRLVLAPRGERFAVFAQRWAMGMLLRLAGVALIPVAVLAARAWFPPQATALGYLGVLLPLLYWETRLVR